MATANPFDLLGDDDAEEPSLLIAAQKLKAEPKKAEAPSSKTESGAPKTAQARLPTKPLPPAKAVKEAQSESARGGRAGGRSYGRGRGGGGSHRDSSYKESSYENKDFSSAQGASEAENGKPFERRGGYGGPREPSRGGRRGGFSNGEGWEGDRYRRRQFDRHSGTGQGNELKREGAGRGNWGTDADEFAQVAEGGVEDEKSLIAEKPAVEENAAADGDQAAAKNDVVVEKPEDKVKEMTLEEYEKVLEEKRKALQSLKTESRKVDTKEFESMQPLSNKKTNDDIFIKLGSDNKDKKKELSERDERAKKSVSINEFLKPVGGRGQGRGRGFRGGRGGGGGGGGGGDGETSNAMELFIQDPGQFPSLGGK